MLFFFNTIAEDSLYESAFIYVVFIFVRLQKYCFYIMLSLYHNILYNMLFLFIFIFCCLPSRKYEVPDKSGGFYFAVRVRRFGETGTELGSLADGPIYCRFRGFIPTFNRLESTLELKAPKLVVSCSVEGLWRPGGLVRPCSGAPGENGPGADRLGRTAGPRRGSHLNPSAPSGHPRHSGGPAQRLN